MRREPAAMFLDNFAGVSLAQQRLLIDPAVFNADAYRPSLDYFDRASGTLLGRVLYTDIKSYLVELLMKQDQMSMSTSIESRVPFLDHHLVEFAARLPDRMKLSGFTTKRVLRAAVRGLLPESILTRPKMGFPVPFSGWVAGRWHSVAREVLLDHRTRERGIVNPGGVELLLADHRAGRRRGGDAIWALMNLELWFRTFIDGEGMQTLPSPDTRRSVPGVGNQEVAA
jgi:asparagine synthase (glutamine-hydrolysing)